MSAPRQSGIELVAYISLAACLGIVQFTIFGADLLVIPGLLWILIAFREGRRPDVPAFFLPLLVFAALTLVSCAFSLKPIESLTRSRQLLLFLVVPGVSRLLRGDRAMTTLNVIIALGGAAALIGVVQYAALGFDHMNHRPRGTLGHYMTYSGILMLVTCAAAARLIFYTREWIWPAVAVPALLVALVLTESRNAWVGTLLAISGLLAIRNLKLLLAVPVFAVVAALALVAAPTIVQQRVLSIFNPDNATNRDRVAMIKSGVGIVRDYPWTGVGLNMVEEAYPRYRTPDAVDPDGATGPTSRVHLHNVPVQLAAERGLPALAAWLWFVVVAGRDLFRQLRNGPHKALAGAGAAALVAMLAAGLFEHNFGDTEFLVLFLGLITLPFAASRGNSDTNSAGPQSRNAELVGAPVP